MFFRNVKIKNNVFYDIANILNIEFASLYDGMLDLEIVNNSIYNMALFGFEFTELNSSVILNNVLKSGYIGMTASYDSGNVIDYNTLNGITNPYIGLTPGPHSLSSDPLFTDASNGDLTLQALSPCIDAGIGNDTYPEVPTTDYNGDSRPTDIVDIGAYESAGPGPVPGPTSLSYFADSSKADGAYVTSYINKPVLVTAIQNDGTDTYFDSTSEFGKVVTYYVHEDGRQNKRVIHNIDGTNLTGRVMWSEDARDGIWQKTQIKSYDKDGATHVLTRSSIGTGEDVTHTSGFIYLNTL